MDVTTPSDKVDLVAENDGDASVSTDQPKKEQQTTDATSPILGTSLSEMLTDDVGKHDTDDVEVLVDDTAGEVATVSANGEPTKENASDSHEVDPPPAPKGIKVPEDEPTTSSGQIIKSGDSDANQNMDQEKSESVTSDLAPNSETAHKDSVIKVEPIENQKSHKDHKTDISPKKVQDQLDEVALIMEKFIHYYLIYTSLKFLLTNFFSWYTGSRIA